LGRFKKRPFYRLATFKLRETIRFLRAIRFVDRLRVISTNAGTIKVAQATPSNNPVRNRDKCVFAQIPKTPKDQSIPIGISDKNSQIRGSGSVSSILRQSGYTASPAKSPK